MWKILDLLFPPRGDAAALQAVSIDEFLSFVTPQLIPATRPATVVLLPFSRAVVRSAIHEAKYHGSERAFNMLARVLAVYLSESDDNAGTPIIVPIPLGRKRRKERGYNQIEEVAQRASKECRVSIDNSILVRTRETVSQVSLPRRMREENMRGAFKAICPADTSRTYIVIDDVLTTGATLQAAIEALQEAGAKHITPIAFAH